MDAGGATLLADRRYSARQEEVLDVAETVFLRDGLHDFRIGALAAEASCSRSTLYELAPSKEELLLLVLDRMLRRIMRHGAESIERADDPAGRVEAMLTSGALDFAALGPQFLDAVRGDAPARDLFERRIAESQEILEGLIAGAVAAGQFRDVDPAIAADAIMAIVLHFSDPHASRAHVHGSTSRLAELIDVFLDGLRAHRAGQRGQT
jgi:AcrR family transcriptional regulator